MGATGRIQRKGQVTIPTEVRRRAGLAKGDVVEFAFRRGKIIITPKMAAHEQRRSIDRELAAGLKGPFYGPFQDGKEVGAFLKKWKADSKQAKLKKTG